MTPTLAGGPGPKPVDVIVMESCCHYWMPLAAHLKSRGVSVALVNPAVKLYGI